MTEWQECKLGDIAEFIGGGTPKTTISDYWNGDIPWLSVVDFNSGKKITKLGLENSSTKILNTGDIIISARGTVGVMAVLAKPMTFNQSCYGVRGIEGKTVTNFIFYLLKEAISDLKQIAHGGVFDTITRDTFNEIYVFLPKIEEQQAISNVLSSLDDKIDLLHRQNKTLEAMAETLFRQWFIEEASEDWEEGKLGDEFNFTMGQSPLGSSFNDEFVGVPMFQGNADFGFRFPSERVFTTEPTRFAQTFDTLISVRAPVGAQNMAHEKCCIGRGVAAFRYKNNENFYTYTYFKLRSIMNEIKQFNNEGTVFGSISKSDFEALAITISPITTIEFFEKEVKSINDKVIKNCYQIKTLEKLRDNLLPKLMSGEIRIKN